MSVDEDLEGWEVLQCSDRAPPPPPRPAPATPSHSAKRGSKSRNPLQWCAVHLDLLPDLPGKYHSLESLFTRLDHSLSLSQRSIGNDIISHSSQSMNAGIPRTNVYMSTLVEKEAREWIEQRRIQEKRMESEIRERREEERIRMQMMEEEEQMRINDTVLLIEECTANLNEDQRKMLNDFMDQTNCFDSEQCVAFLIQSQWQLKEAISEYQRMSSS